jgi:uncharacterized membrane protein
VDILNVMGPAMAISGLVWAIGGNAWRSAVLCGLTAVALAMATPIIRHASWVDDLPLWIQWHLRPFGDHTTFTLLPWAGFVFAGAAYGSLLASSHDSSLERLKVAGLTIGGVAVVGLGVYTASRPSIYAASNFWTSSPTYFAVRTGILMIAMGVLFAATAIEPWLVRAFAVLEKFGRNSLFIYWIHVELVYGYTTWVIHRRLPVWGTSVAFLVFCAAMLGAIRLRDRLAARWRTRTPKSASAAPVAAEA